MALSRLLLSSVTVAFSQPTDGAAQWLAEDRLLAGHDGPSNGPSATCMDVCPDAMTFMATTPQMAEVCEHDSMGCALSNPTECSDLAFLKGLCMSPLTTIQNVLADAAACEEACPGAAQVLGDYQFVQQTQNMRIAAGLRRLDGHGRDVREKHAMLNVLCPSEEAVDCFMANQTEACAHFLGTMEKPSVMDHCDVPMAVTLNMDIAVTDAAAFVADSASEMAVAAGIANAAEVEATDVNVELSVQERRLAKDLRSSRRLTETVSVEASILVAATSEVATLADTVNAIETADMALALNEAITAAEITGVTVEVTALEAAAATPASGMESSQNDPDDESDNPSSSSNCAAATIISSLFVLIAQFCFV